MNRQRILWDSGTNIFLELWLLVAPFLLLYAGVTAALWNDVIVGLAVATFAAIRVGGAFRQAGMSWTNVVLGAWLVVAPFVLGYAGVSSALWNDVLIGLLVIILGWRSAAASGTAPSR